MSNKTAQEGSSAEAKTTEKESKSSPFEREAARRDFLKTSVAAGVAACAVGASVCAAVRLVIAPVFVEGTGGKSYPLAPLDSLTAQPQKFTVVDDKQDAWTTLPQQNIGSLFLRKSGDTVQAFHSRCPHAGCRLQMGYQKNPQTGEEEKLFYCPCHSAYFDLDGKRLNTVAPRDMDSLAVEVKEGQVFVKFENFTLGIAEKRTH